MVFSRTFLHMEDDRRGCSEISSSRKSRQCLHQAALLEQRAYALRVRRTHSMYYFLFTIYAV